LKWDVVLAIEDGKKEQAVDSLLAMLNVSRSLGDEPFLISQLVRIATRTIASRSVEWSLAQGELPPEKLKALQAAWAADSEEPILLFGLRGERAIWDRQMENFLNGSANLSEMQEVGSDFKGFAGGLGWWYYRTRLPGDRAQSLRNFNAVIEVARKPVEEQVALKGGTSMLVFDTEHPITKLFFPAIQKMSEANWRTTADSRCVVAGLACERYRMKAGKWPASLESLVPEYLPTMPLDPYDGKPLRLKVLPDGIVVYSIGLNKIDEGGDLKRPDNPNGGDEGFRLWDPKQRRQPPPKPKEEPKDDGP
jgi:hypothetical protein